MPSNHRILCHPLLLLPSVFNLQSELALCIRWPKYWNFNLSISPSNEYSWTLPYEFSLHPLQLEHIPFAIILSLALHPSLMDSLTILTCLVFIHSYSGVYSRAHSVSLRLIHQGIADWGKDLRLKLKKNNNNNNNCIAGQILAQDQNFLMDPVGAVVGG